MNKYKKNMENTNIYELLHISFFVVGLKKNRQMVKEKHCSG